MNSFIIHGDICYSADQNTLITKENGYLVCEDGISLGVFDSIPEEYSGLPLHDYSGMLVMPGMVDLHIHAPQYAYRGLGMDRELLDWLNTYAFPEESKYGDLAYADRAYTIFANAVKNSATTRLVIFGTLHREATELLMDKLEKIGVVSFVGKVNMDRNSPDTLREASAQASITDTERFLKETQHKYKNTYPIITPRFTPSCSDELMAGLGELTKESHVPVKSHLSENPGEVEWVRELCPWAKNYGEAYSRFGLFGKPEKTVMAHCVYSDDDEIAKMKENGVFIAHCPASNTRQRRQQEIDGRLGHRAGQKIPRPRYEARARLRRRGRSQREHVHRDGGRAAGQPPVLAACRLCLQAAECRRGLLSGDQGRRRILRQGRLIRKGL